MKIILAYISGAPNRDDPYISLLPVGLCSLNACLRESGFDAQLANFSGWPEKEIRQQLITLKPDVVGISQWTHNRHPSCDLAALVRRERPGCTIIMGGGHATFCYRELLGKDSPVDIVILGEGETTLLEIVDCCSRGEDWVGTRGIAFRRNEDLVVNAASTPLTDLDRLPFASCFMENSIGVDLELQSEFIITARGCPSACHFCSSPEFWRRRVRFRSPRHIFDEILYIRDRFGLIYFSLRDDTFTSDRTRAIAFCRLLIERKAHILWNCQSRVTALDEELLTWMKRAGCECVQLGVESGSQSILDKLGKAITPGEAEHAAFLVRKTGINLSVYLISDVPDETEDDIQKTMDLIRRIRPDDGYVSPLAYYPGTRLFEDAIVAGRIDKDLFEKCRNPAVYVAATPGPDQNRLLKVLAGHLPNDSRRFQRQKQLLGYCYTTNALAGEWYRQHDDVVAAEHEFREITEQEPDNPWGWYLLAELYAELYESEMAEACYRSVIAIVPKHGPSLAALASQTS